MNSLLLAGGIVALLVVFLMMRLEIGFSILVVSYIWLVLAGQPRDIMVRQALSGVDQFVLLAIPFFLLAGELMNNSGITSRLVRVANLTVGRARGGLAQANIFSSVIFAGLSGAAVADVAAIGSVFIPSMEEEGYAPGFSASVTAASSVIGPIIPPSVTMILYGAITDTSIGGLFLAGIVPGLLLGLSLMGVTFFIARKNDLPRHKSSVKREEAPRLAVNSLVALTMPGIILFGIVFGVFTATEAAAVACGYALLVGLLYYGELNVQNIFSSLLEAIERSVQLYVIIGFAIIFAWVIAMEGIPAILATELQALGMGATEFLFLVAFLLILVGTWLEMGAAMVILAPTLLELAVELSVHPMHFAMVMIITLCIGLITPPLGVCLFVASSVAEIDVWPIAKRIIPFYVADIFIISVVILFPQVSLFLPRTAGLG